MTIIRVDETWSPDWLACLSHRSDPYQEVLIFEFHDMAQEFGGDWPDDWPYWHQASCPVLGRYAVR